MVGLAMTSQRQQRDSKGSDITVRCLKRERERIKRAARSCDETLNKFMLLAALDRAHNVELGKEASNGNSPQPIR